MYHPSDHYGSLIIGFDISSCWLRTLNLWEWISSFQIIKVANTGYDGSSDLVQKILADYVSLSMCSLNLARADTGEIKGK